MGRAFISYSRSSESAVQRIREDLLRSGIDEVWWDKDLIGAQSWWETILHQIRQADVVVCLVDVGTQESLAVRREYQYAVSLGKPLLPILMSSDVSITTMPVELSGRQYVDYREDNAERTTKLVEALSSLPPTPQLPNPLPHAPEMPRSERDYLVERVSSTEPLNEEVQNAVLNQLRRLFRSEDSDQQNFARHWLSQFRGRRELYASVASDIDELHITSRSSKIGKNAAITVIAVVVSVTAFLVFKNSSLTGVIDANSESAATDITAVLIAGEDVSEGESETPETLEIAKVSAEKSEVVIFDVAEEMEKTQPETSTNTESVVRWGRDFTVFEELLFSLCGFQGFSAAAQHSNGEGTILRLRSNDRSIPDQPFRGFDKQVLTKKITELLPNCWVRFDHEITASVARIRVRVQEDL